MSYRLHDEIEQGDTDGELPTRSRHGAHSSDRLGTESGLRPYTYERPAGSTGRSRHAAPDDGYSSEYSSERDSAAAFSWRTPSGPGLSGPAVSGPALSGPALSGPASVRSWETESYSCETGSHSYHTGSDEAYVPPPPRWTPDDSGSQDTEYRNTTFGDTGYGDARYRSYLDTDYSRETVRGGEPSAWDEQALRAAVGADNSFAGYQEPLSYETEPLSWEPEAAQLSSIRTATLAAASPLGPAAVPSQHDVEDEAEPAEIEVPTTPPSAARRILFGRSHVGVRVAAVAVLVVGSAVGIAAGALNNSNPDTVKVTDDIAAPISSAAASATPDAAASQTQAASPAADLLIKQRQQAALNAAKQRATAKAAAAQQTAAAAAKRAANNRASRSEARSSSDSSSGNNDSSSGNNGTTGTAVPSAPVDCKSYSGNRATGCALLQEFSYSTSQMSCLDSLWTRESQWTTTAENSSTGAYGIPQALPGDKMASVADDWKTNAATQIRWGLSYIKGRYSTPCGAWSHSEATGWY